MDRIIITNDIYDNKQVFNIMFIDKNGLSFLTKSPNYKTAVNKKEKFEKYLQEGRLLKEEKSIYKYIEVV
jgi:hypothetical protein